MDMDDKADERAALERVIVGALRSAIHDHGPITFERIGSATKRILGQLQNAKGGGFRGKVRAVE